jgi:hypothetical protein
MIAAALPRMAAIALVQPNAITTGTAADTAMTNISESRYNRRL